MTKKNAAKQTARVRQAKYGGKYLHHRRVVSGEPAKGGARPRITIDELVGLAQENVPADLVGAADRFGNALVVYVVVDPSDELGSRIAASRIAHLEGITAHEALEGLIAEVERRGGPTGCAPLAELMSVDDLGTALNQALAPARIDAVIELVAHFSTPPPADQVHVLAVAEDRARAALASAVELCWCGHPVAQHDATGACTWVGVPDQRPVVGLPETLAKQARELGIPMQCPCAGPLEYYDASGRHIPRRRR